MGRRKRKRERKKEIGNYYGVTKFPGRQQAAIFNVQITIIIFTFSDPLRPPLQPAPWLALLDELLIRIGAAAPPEPGGGCEEFGGNDGRLECGSGQIASSRCLSCMYSSIKLSNFVSMSSAWMREVGRGWSENYFKEKFQLHFLEFESWPRECCLVELQLSLRSEIKSVPRWAQEKWNISVKHSTTFEVALVLCYFSTVSFILLHFDGDAKKKVQNSEISLSE